MLRIELSPLCFRLRCALPMLAWALLASASLAAAASQPAVGGIRCAYWREVPGSLVEDLTSLPAYPDLPGEQVLLKKLEIPENQEGNFGTLIRGFIHPPRDGEYTFYIAGNGQCELWLSGSEETGEARMIASVAQWSMPREWTATPSQQSKPVALKSGQAYYVEVRHKNGGGDNHLAVAWKLPGGEMQAPIGGEYLSPAAEVVVPPPAVSLPALPTAAGRHRLVAEVEYRKEKLSLPILLTLPPSAAPRRGYAGLVFLPDSDQEPDADGYYLQGPDRAGLVLPPDATFVGISLQPPAGRTFGERFTLQAMAAVTRELASQLKLDRQRLALSGSGSGGLAVWQLSAEMPGFFRALAPICGMEIRRPGLAELLAGARVHIYTDIGQGFATECANRMRDRLSSLQPKPEVIYLGEKELGKGNAADYCYAQPVFYARLFEGDKPQPLAPVAGRSAKWWYGGGLAVLLIAVMVYAASRSRRPA